MVDWRPFAQCLGVFPADGLTGCIEDFGRFRKSCGVPCRDLLGTIVGSKRQHGMRHSSGPLPVGQYCSKHQTFSRYKVWLL